MSAETLNKANADEDIDLWSAIDAMTNGMTGMAKKSTNKAFDSSLPRSLVGI